MKTSVLAERLALADLDSQLAAVDARLEAAVRTGNPAISLPALRVVSGGGKRLRPVLALAAAVAAGGSITDEVITGAVALELVHAGSLVHDDIMDEAASRRGVPTINAVEGIRDAILVGDFLLARAGELSASIGQEVAGALARAIAELCDGQSRETGSAFDVSRTVADYEASIAGKTAALMRASCEIGALSAGRVEAAPGLARFGTAFGMAFQIVDDVLDVASTAEAMGKPVGNDVKEGVYSLPVLLVLAGARGDDVRALLGRDMTVDSIDKVLRLVAEDGGVTGALRRAAEFNEGAAAALADLPPGPTADGLRELPTVYLDWAVQEKMSVIGG
ncbi:MAG TPA: polyprenyl synthetase family protein [Acidimicrobiales bacterium]|nr:polyprenyl synthetase family protein [Acidimicrobiales bacterium]